MELFSFYSLQYELVKGAREALLLYCKDLDPVDFTQEHPHVGHSGSIRNLLVHIVHSYEFWIEMNAFKKEIHHVPFEEVSNIEEVVKLFDAVNIMMEQFISKASSGELKAIAYTLHDRSEVVDPFTVFTHVITHEFHHKGQILSLSRILGYTPIDTDIVR